MSFRRALLAATILTAPTLAAAQPLTGLYIGAGGGYNYAESSDTSIRSTTGGNLGDARVKFDDGFVGLLSVGYGFGNGFRVEVEGNYRQNDVDSVSGRSGALRGAGFRNAVGFQRTYGVMGNVFYDFDLANFGLGRSIIQPYIGGGAGYAWTEWHKVNATTGVGAGSTRLSVNDEDGRFAYQAIAGIGTPLTWLGVTGLTLTAEYRFFGVDEPRLDGTFRNSANLITSRARVEPQNYNHSALLGIRYAFNQPAPPPPPSPGPAPVTQAPARTYLVFFDWDRADLTGRAREIIAEAAQNARRVQTTRIEVAGHADRSGTPQYNQRLSQRRADVVAAELVNRGINRNEIAITAFGESRPLVPTADGVREPQNRRVEIVLR